MEQQNLTDALDIKHALEKKLGYGALQLVADVHAVKLPIVSNAISGRRRSPRDMKILAWIAAEIGQPVLGVLPDGKELENF